MSDRYEEINAAGGQVVVISVDAPPQNAAMIEKLGLPFPILSDPDRDKSIGPYGATDEKDARQISKPAIFVVTPDMEVAFEDVSTDFADRAAEVRAIEALKTLDLAPTTPEKIEVGPAEPGAKALPVKDMAPYYRGAKFAGVALRMRFPDRADEIKTYIDQMDRYLTLSQDLKT